MPKLNIGKLNLYYELSGEGPDVVLIPGLACDHSFWDLSRFKGFRTLVFDNRSVGLSDLASEDYPIMAFAQDCKALCEKLGIKKAHFVGHSMGGHIAQLIAAHFPEMVDKLVLACSEQEFSAISYYSTKAQVELWEQNLPRAALVNCYLPLLFSENFLQNEKKVEEFIQGVLSNPHPQSKEGYLQQLKAIRGHDTKAILSKIKSQTLVIGCDEDLLTPLKNSIYLKDHIPGAILKVIHGSSHLPNVEKPDEFYQTIASFIC